MKLTQLEREILEKAFEFVDDYYAWDDEYEPEDYLEKVQPIIHNLLKKLDTEL
jgi:hypothetical protein